ncbi:MAG: hypothetical protein GY754_20380 [bacterium]|nr:hypothetical protein [bacterium]
MVDKINLFKRANFFTGLMASSQFWNEIQDYNMQKEQFYNRVFHGFGIVPEVMEELHISAVKTGGNLKIIVGSGFAIDKLGRGLFMYEPQAKIIDYMKYKLPTTIYIIVRYNELLDEFYQNKENPEHQGYQKKIETAVVDITSNVPDNIEAMEIGRIYLEEDENGEIKSISEPEDITHPIANEIDTRFVTWASSAKTGLSPYLRKYLVDILDKTKAAAAVANDSINLPGLRELQTISLTAKMLVQCGDVDFKDIINVLYPLYDINNHVIQEILDYERTEEKRPFSSKDSFNTYRTRVHEMGDLIKYYDNKLETLDKIFKCQEDILNSLKNLIAVKKTTLDDISLLSYDLPRILVIEDDRYTLVDFLDFNDYETEERNEVVAEETKDYTSSKQSFSYPDGVEVKDTIKRYVAGEVSFTIRNLIKKRELIMIRRTDIFHGNYNVDVFFNDEPIGQLIIDGYDSKNRWRNLALTFEEDLLLESAARITFKMGENGRDNFGKVWFYQKI